MKEKDLEKFIKNALLEDIGDGDHTSIASIPKTAVNTAHLIIKDQGVIAGIKLAEIIFNIVDPNINFKALKKDGDKVNPNDTGFIVSGKSRSILKAERVVLNCMQNMSAIATKTSLLNHIISKTKCKILDTRKTTPLNRKIEKWAVRIGGGQNHRFGLYDMIMIKDNHIDCAKGINNAIINTKKYLKKNNKNLDIIVEARNIYEVKEIIKHNGIKRILLDNFNYTDTKKAVNIINGKCETESSGNINNTTILKYAECGVDYISVGALTHSKNIFDLSLKTII